MATRTTLKVLTLIPAFTFAVAACAQPVGDGAGPGAGGVQLVKSGKLLTCTHLPYEPFQFREGGEVVGFDVDLVNLVAKDLGVTQEIIDTPFEGIASGEDLNTGKCDVAAAGMTITDVRKQNFDFSDPYFDASQALLVRKGGAKDLAALKGKKLGVQQGTTGEQYAQKNKATYGYEITNYEDLALLLEAAKNGSVDAAINDDFVIKDFVRKNPDTEVSVTFQTNEKYGIGVKKGNTALLAKVNEVLKRALSDGTYDAIYEKWFREKPKK